MPPIVFKFSDEQLLSTEKKPDENAFFVAADDEEDSTPKVDKHAHSVVVQFARTWACFCKCPVWGCGGKNSRSVVRCGREWHSFAVRRDRMLWAVNLVCLAAHLVLAFLCLTACAADRSGTKCTAEGMEVPIMRASSRWTSASADGYAVTFVRSGHSARFDLVVAWFFLLSAIAHSLPVFFGLLPHFNVAYWNLIDAAICPWRWIEYAASAPIMFFSLQISVGIRDLSTLVLSWVLMSLVMVCGLATEACSRPAARDSKSEYRGWKGDPTPTASVENAKKMIANGKRRLLSGADRSALRKYEWDYRVNYLFRLIPHFVGWVPYVAVWTLYFYHFSTTLSDLRRDDEDIFDRVPDFVPWAVGATCIWFTSFAFVQLRYQWLSPDYYYRTEVWYCILSAGSKITLGVLLYVNVLMYASFEEALSDTAANRAAFLERSL